MDRFGDLKPRDAAAFLGEQLSADRRRRGEAGLFVARQLMDVTEALRIRRSLVEE